MDDIIDDSLYDQDLEEIQIEPDIIDYDEGSSNASSTGNGSSCERPNNTTNLFPQLPSMPIPKQDLVVVSFR